VLVGAFIRPGRQGRGHFHPLGKLGPARYAGVTFDITLRRCGRGAATRWNRCNGAFELDSTPYESHYVSRTHFTGGLYPVAVHMHLAAIDGLGRQGTRLEKAHAEEPPVYAGGSRTFIGTIFGHGREYN
jgi:hypothetical protein